MAVQDCSQVVTKFEGNTFGHLGDIAIGPNGEVVIIDSDKGCVIVLDDKLDLLKVIGQGSGLVNPDGVAVTDDIIAVTDWDSRQVKKYSLQGELLSVIGCRGDNDGEFKQPRGLAFNNNKFLYVVDRATCRIQVFQPDDMFSFSFRNRGPNPGRYQFPDRIAIDCNDNVLITNHGAECIHLFTYSGQFIREIKCQGSPYAVVITATGYVITSHAGDNKIRIWSPTLQLIKQFGQRGSKQGEFRGITGMAIDLTGSLYVVEWFNKRLQVISNS